MERKICCVTGHRDIPEEKVEHIKEELCKEIDQAIQDGYSVFISGFAEGTDLLFAECVIEAQKKYPKIYLEAAFPHEGSIKKLDKYGKELFDHCFGYKVVSIKVNRDCYMLRNRYMINQSDRLIAVYDGRSGGGTCFTMDYAKNMGRELRVIQLVG